MKQKEKKETLHPGRCMARHLKSCREKSDETKRKGKRHHATMAGKQRVDE